DQIFIGGDGKACRYTRFLINEFALSGFKCDLLHQILQQAIDLNSCLLFRSNASFLEGNLAGNIDALWIMGEDLAFDTVFERRYDGAPVGVVFGVGRKYKLDVKGQAKFKSANLDVFFLQHVEQRNLYTGLQVGKLVDNK